LLNGIALGFWRSSLQNGQQR